MAAFRDTKDARDVAIKRVQGAWQGYVAMMGALFIFLLHFLRLVYDIFTTFLRHFYDISTTFLRLVYDMFTTFLQLVYNIFTTFLRHFTGLHSNDGSRPRGQGANGPLKGLIRPSRALKGPLRAL